MQATVNRSELASTFTWVAAGLPTRAVVPVLRGMLLTVGAGAHKLALSAFNYEMSLRSWVPGTDAIPGSILVDGAALRKVISKGLPRAGNYPVILSATDDTLTITAEGITWTLPALPRDEYPQLPELPPVAGVIDGSQFARAVTRVAAAADTDDTLPALTCIYLETHPAALVLAATDRYRVAHDRMFWTPADVEAPSMKALVPARELVAFAKAAGEHGKVTVHLDTDLAGFADDDREMTIWTSSGEFPKWRGLRRTESPVSLTVDAPGLAGVVTRIGAMAERNMPVFLHYRDSELVVEARDGEVSASQAIPCTATVPVMQVDVNFNPAYLSSMLAGFGGAVQIGLAGLSPNGKIATIRAAGDTFEVLLMSIRSAA